MASRLRLIHLFRETRPPRADALVPRHGLRLPDPRLPVQIDTIQAPLPTGRIVIYGDSRPAITGEQFFMGRTDPAQERGQIIDEDRRRETGPGRSQRRPRRTRFERWPMGGVGQDAQGDPRRENPLYPALGNHEYAGDTRKALGYFRNRFPALGGCRWYSVKAGPLLFVMLDTNFDELAPAFVEAQDGWYRKTLDEAAKDTEVKAVIVVSHHPPYSNSNVHEPERRDSPSVRRPRRLRAPSSRCTLQATFTITSDS